MRLARGVKTLGEKGKKKKKTKKETIPKTCVCFGFQKVGTSGINCPELGMNILWTFDEVIGSWKSRGRSNQIKPLSASRKQINSSSENNCTILEWNAIPSFQSGGIMRSHLRPVYLLARYVLL